jgi:hypothetical protein
MTFLQKKKILVSLKHREKLRKKNRMKKYDKMLGKLKWIDDMVFGNRIKDSGK